MNHSWRRGICRLLGAKIRPGEGRAVALFAMSLFLLLCAYYVLKVVREPLILLEGGEVSRSYARGLQAFLLLGIIPAYGALADRIDPRRLVSAVMAFFAACLLAFRLLAFANARRRK